MHEVTTGVQIVLPQHCNGYEKPRLFGGQLMAWIEDNLTFLEPAYLNDTVVQEARVTWTGRTSLEVRVDTFVEHIDRSREAVNRAYLVFVAIDGDGRPVPVPPFTPEDDAEREEYEAAVLRKKQRLEK